jgi:hypothetical protein
MKSDRPETDGRNFDFSRRMPGAIAAKDLAVGIDSALCEVLRAKGYEFRAHIRYFRSDDDGLIDCSCVYFEVILTNVLP